MVQNDVFQWSQAQKFLPSKRRLHLVWKNTHQTFYKVFLLWVPISWQHPLPAVRFSLHHNFQKLTHTHSPSFQPTCCFTDLWLLLGCRWHLSPCDSKTKQTFFLFLLFAIVTKKRHLGQEETTKQIKGLEACWQLLLPNKNRSADSHVWPPSSFKGVCTVQSKLQQQAVWTVALQTFALTITIDKPRHLLFHLWKETWKNWKFWLILMDWHHCFRAQQLKTAQRFAFVVILT